MRTDPIKQLKSSRRRRSKGSAGTDLSGHAPAAAELERGGFRPAGLLLNRKGSVRAGRAVIEPERISTCCQGLIQLFATVYCIAVLD